MYCPQAKIIFVFVFSVETLKTVKTFQIFNMKGVNLVFSMKNLGIIKNNTTKCKNIG